MGEKLAMNIYFRLKDMQTWFDGGFLCFAKTLGMFCRNAGSVLRKRWECFAETLGAFFEKAKLFVDLFNLLTVIKLFVLDNF